MVSFGKALNALVTAILVLSAASVAVVAVRREFGSDHLSLVAAQREPEYVADWRELRSHGRWIGDSSAMVQIIEFSDYECPFCRRFHDRFAMVHSRLGDTVALLRVHYPLPGHRFARMAAVVAECAYVQGRWMEIHAMLYAKQDSFGLKPWTEIAADAGVADMPRFEECLGESEITERIDSDIKSGNNLGVNGTPTILVNGWRYHVPPYDSLEQVIRASLEGR
ncbi:MAG TPA: thioredoxin domain-containing protein [Gemmatimonadales bacterium]|nr:thioredoxin domain-containing protein [Gemmatimonadales bacterium]